MIRARIRADLENLRQYCPLSEIVTSVQSDYPYRAFAWKTAWAEALKRLGDDLNYTNFKSEVSHKQGWGRHDLYMKVWSTMMDAEHKIADREKFWKSPVSKDFSKQTSFDLSADLDVNHYKSADDPTFGDDDEKVSDQMWNFSIQPGGEIIDLNKNRGKRDNYPARKKNRRHRN